MIQDRNVHRDAKFLRRTASGLWYVGDSQTDKDTVQYITQPRWNFRLTGLSVSGNTVEGTALWGAGVLGPLDAAGSPLCLPGTAVATFQLDEFKHRRNDNTGNDILRERNGPVAQAFTDPFTISDGFWGVYVVLITHSGVGQSTVTTLARSSLMEFPTEQIALDNCPQIPTGFGRVAIGTIQAVGGDFIAGTTNTDAGLVAAFNTFDQYGLSMLIDASPAIERFYFNAGAADFLKDPSGTSILQGRGVAGATEQPMDRSGDMIYLTMREVGGSVGQINPERSNWTLDYRPWPVGGEGVGDASVSQNRPEFVP